MEKNKIIRSLFYKFTERFAVKLIGMVIGILLARLLTPEIIGQVTLLEVFANLSLALIDSGVNSTLVQAKKTEERDYATVFYITLALAVPVVALIFAAAPAIADYYKSPELTLPLRIYVFSLLFSSFNSIQVARMQREMRFREMMFCSLGATVLSGTIGIVLAFRGAGLWALVVYHFARIVLFCLLILIFQRWIPHGRFSVESARRLSGFGLKIMAASVVAALYNNIRPLIIGRRFSTEDLGYYNRGQNFSSTVSLNLDAAVKSVMFPVLSRSQEDRGQFLAMLRHTKQMGCFVIFPVMLGMAAVAEPMVLLLLTDKWLPAAPFVTLLCLGEAQVPLTSSNLVALKSLGRSDLYFRQEILRRVLMLIVLVISVLAFRSVTAIAAGFVLSAWLDCFVTSLPLKKLLEYGIRDQFRDVWKSGLGAVLMAGAVWACGLLPLPLLPKLLLQILCGGACYLLLNALLKNESFFLLLRILKHGSED